MNELERPEIFSGRFMFQYLARRKYLALINLLPLCGFYRITVENTKQILDGINEKGSNKLADMEDVIINKIAESGLITLNLEDYLPESNELAVFDIKDYLFRGLLLREKDFRTALQQMNWNIYQNKYVTVTCSVDAIIPLWSYMLVTTYLQPIAKVVLTGAAESLKENIWLQRIADIDVNTYVDKRVVVKGCGDVSIPPSAYLAITNKLRPVVKSIMYGEPCSTVPIFKKK